MNTLVRLQNWYAAQCDGHWERQYGVKIDTLDNPGWALTVDLEGTALEEARWDGVSYERSENDWVACRLKDRRFYGDGGPGNLEELLTIFLDWAERQP
jgi:hypothetical protein